MKIKDKRMHGNLEFITVITLLFMVILMFGIRYYPVEQTVFESRYVASKIYYDAFQYIRSWMVSIFGLVLIGWYALSALNGEIRLKGDRYTKLLLGLGGLIILSSIFTKYPSLVLQGAIDNYENVFVQLSYIVIATVISGTAGRKRGNLKWFEMLSQFSVFIITASSLMAIFQILGNNPLEWGIVRRIIAPEGLWENKALFMDGKMAYAFYGNPNYLSNAIGVFLPFLLLRLMNASDRFNVISYTAIFSLAQFALLCSRSLSSLLFAPVGLLICFWLLDAKIMTRNKQLCVMAGYYLGTGFYALTVPRGLNLKEITAAVTVYTVIAVVLYVSKKINITKLFPIVTAMILVPGVWFSFGMLQNESRLSNPNYLLSFTLENNEIQIVTSSEKLSVKVENGQIRSYDSDGLALEMKTTGEPLIFENSRSDQLEIHVRTIDGHKVLEILPYKTRFFVLDNEFRYINSAGIEDTLQPSYMIGPKGFEHLGSGRMYLWQSSVGMVLQHPLLGVGPDAFSVAFPQNDIAGKYNHSGDVKTLISKPHNIYIQIAAQLGIPALMCFLVINGAILKVLIKDAKNNSAHSDEKAALSASIICWLALGLVNDSKVFTSPYYWIILGIALYMIRRSDSCNVVIVKG